MGSFFKPFLISENQGTATVRGFNYLSFCKTYCPFNTHSPSLVIFLQRTHSPTKFYFYKAPTNYPLSTQITQFLTSILFFSFSAWSFRSASCLSSSSAISSWTKEIFWITLVLGNDYYGMVQRLSNYSTAGSMDILYKMWKKHISDNTLIKSQSI